MVLVFHVNLQGSSMQGFMLHRGLYHVYHIGSNFRPRLARVLLVHECLTFGDGVVGKVQSTWVMKGADAAQPMFH